MSQNLRSRQVHQIPVVRLLPILQIHRHNLITLPDSLCIIYQSLQGKFLKPIHQYQQSAQPHLMPFRQQQVRHLSQREILRGSLNHLSRLRHFQPQELITLAILTGTRLKEPHEHSSLLLIPQRLHVFDNLLCRHLFRMVLLVTRLPPLLWLLSRQ